MDALEVHWTYLKYKCSCTIFFFLFVASARARLCTNTIIIVWFDWIGCDVCVSQNMHMHARPLIKCIYKVDDDGDGRKKPQHKKCIQFELGELYVYRKRPKKKRELTLVLFLFVFWPPLLSIIRLVNVLFGKKTINASNFFIHFQWNCFFSQRMKR